MLEWGLVNGNGGIIVWTASLRFLIIRTQTCFPVRNVTTPYISVSHAELGNLCVQYSGEHERKQDIKKNFTPWYYTPHRYHKAGNSKWQHVWVENSVNKNKNRNSKSIRKILWSHHFHTSLFVGEKKASQSVSVKISTTITFDNHIRYCCFCTQDSRKKCIELSNSHQYPFKLWCNKTLIQSISNSKWVWK